MISESRSLGLLPTLGPTFALRRVDSWSILNSVDSGGA